jgi:hypothetical protein
MTPKITWFEDTCAGIKCSCGKEFMIVDNEFTRCSGCRKQYKLKQKIENEILEKGD